MDTLRKSDVVGLARRSGRWCVTITLPTPRSVAGTTERALVVRSALRDAEEMLLDRGVRAADAASQLAPLADRARDREFWRGTGDGLATYLSEPEPLIFRLGRTIPSRVFVGERHLVLPLLPFLEPPERFYVLALSQNAVRLVRASRDGSAEVELAEEARSLAAALSGYDPDPQFQYHTASAAPGRGGARSAPVSHGAGVRPHKVDLEIFLRRVDAEMSLRLHGDDAPVVLAGVDPLLSIFRGLTGLSAVAEGAVEGNPDALSADALHRRAAGLLEPAASAQRGAAVAACREILGRDRDRAAATLAEIVPAAEAGRVATLLVAEGARRFGTFDRATGALALHDEPRNADDDLVDFAAARTFLNRGAVHVLPADEIPGGGIAAAILRY